MSKKTGKLTLDAATRIPNPNEKISRKLAHRNRQALQIKISGKAFCYLEVDLQCPFQTGFQLEQIPQIPSGF